MENVQKQVLKVSLITEMSSAVQCCRGLDSRAPPWTLTGVVFHNQQSAGGPRDSQDGCQDGLCRWRSEDVACRAGRSVSTAGAHGREARVSNASKKQDINSAEGWYVYLPQLL